MDSIRTEIIRTLTRSSLIFHPVKRNSDIWSKGKNLLRIPHNFLSLRSYIGTDIVKPLIVYEYKSCDLCKKIILPFDKYSRHVFSTNSKETNTCMKCSKKFLDSLRTHEDENYI